MATVYLAEDLRLRRRVALKVLHPDLAATLGPERFLREIQIASRLTHPHILALHDSGEADRRLFYAMPCVDGESLRQRLDREGQLLLRWQDAPWVGRPWTVGDALSGPTFLLRAEIEEARGRPLLTQEYYQQFLRRYDRPVASQAHLVKEAKAALLRLSGNENHSAEPSQ